MIAAPPTERASKQGWDGLALTCVRRELKPFAPPTCVEFPHKKQILFIEEFAIDFLNESRPYNRRDTCHSNYTRLYSGYGGKIPILPEIEARELGIQGHPWLRSLLFRKIKNVSFQMLELRIWRREKKLNPGEDLEHPRHK